MIVDHIDSMGYDSLDVLNRLVDHCLQGVAFAPFVSVTGIFL